MRIVGGRWRGRQLQVPAGREIRPTSERAREAVFDRLENNPIFADHRPQDAMVIDAFAGTGALGLEALSRGARQVWFFETDARALEALNANIEALAAEDQAIALRRDACRPGAAPTACGLAFLDPPYGTDLAAPALAALRDGGWLTPGAVAIVESGHHMELPAPDGFETIDTRRYGAAQLTFLRVEPKS